MAVGDKVIGARGLLASNVEHDLALIQTEIKRESVLELGEEAEVGAPVYVIGNPEGLEASLSTGIVSSIRVVKGGEVYQFTAPISGGSSGSPLLDSKARVIGIVSSSLGTPGAQNINFAIHAKYLAQMLASLPEDAVPQPFSESAKSSGPSNTKIDATLVLTLPPSRETEKTIGRLGVARRASKIYASGAKKRVLAQIPSGTYLALTGRSGEWFGVLMADQDTGWVNRRDVKLLDYEVVGPETPHKNAVDSTASAAKSEWDQFKNARNHASLGGSAVLSGGQQTVLTEAYRHLGVPYKAGGTSSKGIDGPAFVRRCFLVLGIKLPHSAAEQSAVGAPVSAAQLQAADRLYFASRDGRIIHTGIYIGDGYFIHSSSKRGGVAVSRLTEPTYRRMFAGARR